MVARVLCFVVRAVQLLKGSEWLLGCLWFVVRSMQLLKCSEWLLGCCESLPGHCYALYEVFWWLLGCC